MKILIDENLPLKLKENFGAEHEIYSVRDMEWTGRKNGELLGLMTLEGFDALITMDKNLHKQQNLSKFAIAIFVLIGVTINSKRSKNLFRLCLSKLKPAQFPVLL